MTPKMKNLILLIPGLFDAPHPQLEGLTPLEKANTPHLDEIAQQGQWIRVLPPKGGLERSLIELFGLKSEQTNLSKSSLEIYAQKVPFKPNQSSYLFKYGSFLDGELVSNVDLRAEELQLLCQDLTQKFGEWGHFYPLSHSCGVARLNEPFEVGSNLFAKKHTQEKLEQIFSFLDAHPLNLVRGDFEEPLANGLTFFEGGGPLCAITSKRFYERFCLFSPRSYSKGLAYLLEMKSLEIYPDDHFEYFSTLIQEAKEELYTRDTVVLEIHEILKSTLSGQLLEKIKRIEYIDKNLIGPILKLARDYGVQIVLSPIKPSHLKKQTLLDEPAPWIIFNPKHKKGLEPILALREKEFRRIQGNFSIQGLASQFLY